MWGFFPKFFVYVEPACSNIIRTPCLVFILLAATKMPEFAIDTGTDHDQSKLILTAKRLRNLDGNKIKRYKSWVILALYLSLQNKPSTGILHLRVSLSRARSLLLIHLKAPLLHVSRFCGLIGMLITENVSDVVNGNK